MLDLLCEIVKQSLESSKQEFTLDRFENGAELLEEKRYKLYDVIFLDINMPGVSGFEIAKYIEDEYANKYIVLISNYSEYMAESFEYHPFYFILKSDVNLLKQAISNILKKITKRIIQNEMIVFEDFVGRKHRICLCDIIYMEVNSQYVHYFVKNKQDAFIIRESILSI